MTGYFWKMLEDKGEEGKEKLLVSLICKKLRKGKDLKTIADEVEEDEIRVKVICDAIADLAPDYDEEKAIEKVRGRLVEA